MDYAHLAGAIDFYRNRGYVYVEDAPWHVGRDAYYATKPPGAHDMHVFEGCTGISSFPAFGAENRYLVASGEQSFLQMMLDGQTLKRAMCITPCHRSDRPDGWHFPYFMKVELINAQDVDDGHLMHMIHDACLFYELHLPAVRIKKTDIGYDIVEKGTTVELGSYGIRRIAHPDGKSKDLSWIYGTGCAEPRLSSVIARHSRFVGK